MKRQIDYSLYLVTDRGLSRGRSTHEIVKMAVDGGASIVQLREKNCDTREFVKEALMIKPFLEKAGVPLIINDRIDVALAVGAEGVHLGQKDMPIDLAKKILPGGMIIGISAESVEDAIRAEMNGADYIGASPVFSTLTKTDTAPPLGLEGLRKMKAAVGIPIVGIGGISDSNAKDVIQNGADGIAVVSAIVSADDPRKAAADLRLKVESAK